MDRGIKAKTLELYVEPGIDGTLFMDSLTSNVLRMEILASLKKLYADLLSLKSFVFATRITVSQYINSIHSKRILRTGYRRYSSMIGTELSSQPM